MSVDDWLHKRTIFECIAGSHAYGLNTPESDEDFRGVCVPPIEYFTGLYSFEQKDGGWPDKADRVIFSVHKFVKLAVDANPNILELLWMPDDCVRLKTPLWEALENNRNLFLSKKLKYTYSGYAVSQLKRIKSHRRWLLDPPTHEPRREEFGLPPKRMSPDLFGVLENLFGRQNEGKSADHLDSDLGIDKGQVFGLFEKERKWRAARREWEQYQTWVRERNPKRAALEAAFGYDTKHASHLFRLMIQGEVTLLTGEVPVRLRDADREMCLAVKQGAFSFDEVIEKAREFERYIEQACEASTLPHAPDRQKISELLSAAILVGNNIVQTTEHPYKRLK